MTPLPDGVSDALVSTNTVKLAELHWYLLKASNHVHSLSIRVIPHKRFPNFEDREITEFGREVGRDPIHWWVWKKETNIEELRIRTERALVGAQSLKKASEEELTSTAKSCVELAARLKNFADSHGADIDEVLTYVRWLNSRDALAPSMLFNYRVWGTTRMSDRHFDLQADIFENEAKPVVRSLAEIVLGLHGRIMSVFDKALWEYADEIWGDGESPETPKEIDVTMPRVVALATTRAYRDCSTYFAFIRDSLRNVLLDIEEFVEQRNLMASDSFWRTFIEKAVRSPKTETLLWDFKETLGMWHAPKPDRQSLRIEFVEDVASFANGRGGVLVIGVADAREIIGIAGSIHDRENLVKAASDAVNNHLEYGPKIVTFHEVIMRVQEAHKVCLVVIISQTCEAVGVNDGNGHYTYPVRQGTGLFRASRVDVSTSKNFIHRDNHDFLNDLEQFTRDN